jgi:regulator of sigma E protease
MGAITYVVASMVVLGVLIIVHETGHFLMARRMGVGVEKFAIGFGPTIWSKTIGETEYKLCAAPLGGYIKMVGDEEGEDKPEIPPDPEKAFNNKPVWRRLLIIAAGPVSNLIFAGLIFSVVYMAGITIPDTKIKAIMHDSVAQTSGMTAGDRIVEIDGKKIKDWGQLAETISTSPGKKLHIVVERAGARAEMDVTPALEKSKTIFGETTPVGRIGISPDQIFKRYNPLEAGELGFHKMYEISVMTVMMIVKIFQKIVPADTIGGPLMIFKIAGDTAQAGIVPLLMFMGVLSVNLGVLNFLPIPILDGGHIVFLAIEKVLGRPLSLRGRELAQQVGMFLLISLMVFAFYNDISRFIADFGHK